MADHGFPMTRNRTRVYIREIIKQGGRTYPYKVSENGPSDEWFRKLFARHPELQERTPDSLDPARSSMSREDVIYPFFDFLDKTLTQYGVKDKPSQIFNCDETGWSGKEKAKEKVITGKREHTISRKVMGGGGNHITAHLCVCADGRFLPTMIIFKGSLPHTRFTDGVPDTWLYGSSSTGYIDHELFQTWFMKGFLPHCGRARPVVLIMDNHDAHISLPVIQAARANDVVLIGFPGHTTHILQPLDVKIIGTLKTNMASLASDLGIVCPSFTIGKSKYPVLLKYAMDRITPSTIIGAFVKAGIVPLDRGAIDKSQLIPAMFPAVQNINDDNSAQTCKECGRFTVNSLVKAGLVPESLADILVPPASKPAAQRNKRRIVTEGRVISGDEIMKELMEREKASAEKDRRDAQRALEADERKRMKEEGEIEKIKRKEERVEKRLAREQEQKKKADEKMDRGKLANKKFTCGVCCMRGRVLDESKGIVWFGCDEKVCGKWYHFECLHRSEQEYLRESMEEGESWYCKACKPWLYCEE
ncbi:uncharacterized protein LOC127881261 [Dreissena polymorpha]|nr:uncharacterized protein LOC127881261 [Dreissena polymorpha]